MTIKSVLPDGTILEFPDNTPSDVVDRVFRKNLADMQTQKIIATKATQPSGMARSAAIGATQGLTANFGDEAASAIAATIGRPGGEAIPGQTWTDRYGNALNIARAGQKEAQDAHPYAYGAGQFAGAVAPAIVAPELMGSDYIAAAPTLLSTVGRSSGIGMLYGGISGFGGAEGTPEQQALQAAKSAGAGAIIGGAIPLVVAGGQKLGSWAWNAAKGVFVPAETVTEAATVAPSFGTASGTTTTALPPPTMTDAVETARPRLSVDPSLNDKARVVNEIANNLRRDGYSVEDVKRMLDAMGPDATMADLGPNMRSLLTAQTSAPGPAKQIASTLLENRQAGEQANLIGAANKALGTGAGFHQTDEAFLTALEKKASPLYDKAYAEAQPVDITPVTDQIDVALNKMPAKSPIRAAIEKVRGMLGDEIPPVKGQNAPTFKPYSDLETLHNAKLAIDDMLSKYSGDESLGNVSRANVTKIKNALLDAMDASNPAYGEARGTFSGIMTSKDALNAGRQFIKQDAETTASTLASLAPEDQQFFREGAKRAIFDIIKSKPSDVSVVQLLRKTGLLEKVQQLVPDEAAFNDFVQSLSNARRFAGTKAGTLSGSQSVEKFLSAADSAAGAAQIGGQVASGNPSGALMSMYKWGRQMLDMSENKRAALAQALLSNDRGAIDKLLSDVSKKQLVDTLMKRGGAAVSTGLTSSAAGRLP